MVDNELAGLEHELQKAVQRRDRPLLERLVAPEYTLTSPRLSLDRQQWIDMALGAFVLESFSFTHLEVQVFGETAIVDMQLHQVASAGGQPAPADWMGTDVWVRRAGQWQLVKRCVFPVAEQPT